MAPTNCLSYFLYQKRKRDRQLVTTDSCPGNRAAEPGSVSWKQEMTSQKAKAIEKAIEFSVP